MKANQSLYSNIEWIPSGFAGLDKILGGGTPHRKILECSGVFSVGKSTLGLHFVAQAQKQGKPCLWADSEFSFGEEYANTLGVDCSKLDLLQERFAEVTLDAIEEWANENKNGLIVLDSIGGLLPRQEAEKSADGKTIGAQAKLIATFCRKITPILAINNNALIVLNHQFVDLMSGKLKTSGGAKLEYSKSIWLMLRSANKNVMQGENQVGLIIQAEIRKNKIAPTSKQRTELTMLFGKGFSSDDLMQTALDKGIITKEGQMFFFEGVKIARGLNGLREALKDVILAEKVKLAITNT